MNQKSDKPANYQSGGGPANDIDKKKRDPEDRQVNQEDIREKSLDKTLADSFPTSDPPSSIPDPGEDDSNE